MGNSNRATMNKFQGKQNLNLNINHKNYKVNKINQNTNANIKCGIIQIYSKSSKKGGEIYFISFKNIQSKTTKIIKWRKGQFQIIQCKNQSLNAYTKIYEIGQYPETDIIDAITWSTRGIFAIQENNTTAEWCQTVCWKLGKKIKLN